MKNHRILLIKSFLIFVTGFIAGMPHLHAQPDTENYAETIYVNGRDVQQVIDKPLRLTNFRGRLAPGTTDTRILQIDAEYVIVENIHISKNNSQPVISVQYSEGLMIRNVFIENLGDTENASIRAVDVSDLLIDGVNVRTDGNLGGFSVLSAKRKGGSPEYTVSWNFGYKGFTYWDNTGTIVW